MLSFFVHAGRPLPTIVLGAILVVAAVFTAASPLYAQSDPPKEIKAPAEPPPAPSFPRTDLRQLETLKALESLPPRTNQVPVLRHSISEILVDPDRDLSQKRFKSEQLIVEATITEAEELIAKDGLFQAISLLDEVLSTCQYEDNRRTLLIRKGHIYLALGNEVEAESNFRKALSIKGDDYDLIMVLAAMKLNHKDYQSALKLLSRINPSEIQEKGKAFILLFNKSCAYAMAGQPDAALANLVEAGRLDAWFTHISLEAPQLDSLRRDPRFITFRDKIEAQVLGPDAPNASSSR